MIAALRAGRPSPSQRQEVARHDFTGRREQPRRRRGPAVGQVLACCGRSSPAWPSPTRRARSRCTRSISAAAASTPWPRLPHVGAVAGRADPERVSRIIRETVNLVAAREQLFARSGLDGIAAYRVRRASGGLRRGALRRRLRHHRQLGSVPHRVRGARADRHRARRPGRRLRRALHRQRQPQHGPSAQPQGPLRWAHRAAPRRRADSEIDRRAAARLARPARPGADPGAAARCRSRWRASTAAPTPSQRPTACVRWPAASPRRGPVRPPRR